MTHTNRLRAQSLALITKPGRHADGRGLYLNVTKNGGRSWVLLYRSGGRTRELGLGSASVVSLKDARALAEAASAKIRDGRDPISERRVARAGKSGIPTFEELATEIVADRAPTWRSAKHRQQWLSSLQQHAKTLMPLPVDAIDADLILKALRPMTKGSQPRLVTARRVLNRIEMVLSVATLRKFRSGANPAIWRGGFETLLPALKKIPREHHPALPVDQIPLFVAELAARPIVSAAALRFTVLTAARSAEVRFATWQEIDFATATWLLAGSRLKSGRPHRIPLSAQALALLHEQPRTGPYIFAGRKPGTAMTEAVFVQLLARMGRSDITTHGTARAGFRTWATEVAKARYEVCEAALGHAVGDMTVRAYARTDHLEERRELMASWGAFVTSEIGKVVRLRARTS